MITFNSLAASAYADIVSIQRISRPASPGSRARLLEITGRDGVYYFGKDGKTQSVNFRLTLNSTSIANRRIAIRQIAAWLETDDVAVLSFTDEPTIIYYAVLTDAIPAEEFATVGFLDVSFLIPDGCAYSSTTDTAQPQEEQQTLFLGGATGGTFLLGDSDYNFTWNQYDGLRWDEVI